MTMTVGMAKKPKVGFLGAGFMARVHSIAARNYGAELWGIATINPAGARDAAAAYGIPRVYEHPDELLQDPEIDIVHICTPNVTHADYARAALALGKGVVCEKPLATSVAAAAELVELSRTADKLAVVPFVYRYHPMVREARERIKRGELGRVLSVQGAYLQDWLIDAESSDWRVTSATGGPSRAFADIGSHLADLMEFVVGDRIEELVATTEIVHPRRGDLTADTEDLVALVARLRNGGLASLLVSQVWAGKKNELVLDISGTAASVRFDQEHPDEIQWRTAEGVVTLPRVSESLSTAAARLSNVPAGHPMGYQDAFNNLISDAYRAWAQENGAIDLSASGLPQFADGLRAAQITAAVMESAQTGAWVRVEG